MVSGERNCKEAFIRLQNVLGNLCAVLLPIVELQGRREESGVLVGRAECCGQCGYCGCGGFHSCDE